jgi:hypothetical protein
VRLIRDMSSPLVRPFAAVGGRSVTADIPAIAALAVYVVLLIVAGLLLDALVRSVAGSTIYIG